MQVTIHGQTKYIPVSTVTLVRAGENETYPFHCINCGNTSNIIGGKVVKIYPIFEPSDQIPVLSTCKACKTKYVFQDSTEVVSDGVKVLLYPKDQLQSFFCYLGGGEVKSINKILEYNKIHSYSFYANAEVHLPLITKCTNRDCDLIYQFNQLS